MHALLWLILTDLILNTVNECCIEKHYLRPIALRFGKIPQKSVFNDLNTCRHSHKAEQGKTNLPKKKSMSEIKYFLSSLQRWNSNFWSETNEESKDNDKYSWLGKTHPGNSDPKGWINQIHLKQAFNIPFNHRMEKSLAAKLLLEKHRNIWEFPTRKRSRLTPYLFGHRGWNWKIS